MKKIKYLALALLMGGGVLITGCKDDFLNNVPASSVSDGFMREHPESMRGIVEGIHSMFYSYNLGGQSYKRGLPSLNSLIDILGDDHIMTLGASSFTNEYFWYRNSSEKGTFVFAIWDYMYTLIQHCNYAIDIANSATTASEAEKASTLGEAYTIRAFCYHYLVQCFGPRYVKGEPNDSLGVIIRKQVAYDPMPRSTVAQVYEFIEEDLAKGLDYLSKAPDLKRKNVISYATALGIASRIALTKQEYDRAEKYAKMAIENTSARLSSGEQLLSGFNDWNDPEWMWAYHPAEEQDYYYAGYFSRMAYNTNLSHYRAVYAVNRDIYDPMGPKDVRRKWWICMDLGDEIPADANLTRFFSANAIEFTGHPVKWKVKDPESSRGDLCIMRLAEMYYNLAEAQARQGKYTEAQTTLNTVMKTRDPEYNTTLTGNELTEEIMRNKRVDFWQEGLRFFDMKRLGIVPDRGASKNIREIVPRVLASKEEQAKIMKLMKNTGKAFPVTPANISKYYTSSVYLKYMPKDMNAKGWVFAIPYGEVVGSHGLVKQNPLP